MNSLKSKLSSLVSVNRRDSSIFARLNQSNISITNLVNKNELVKFFETDKNILEINVNLNISEIENELMNSQDCQSFVDYLDKYQIYISLTKRNLLEKNFNQSNKKELVKIAINYLENIKLKLMSLQRKAKSIEKDKGSWNLYIARYFLKGVTPYKKQVINAPLILYQVEIINYGTRIVIKKINDFNELNEKLIVFLQRDLGKQKKSISDFNVHRDIETVVQQLEEILETKLDIDKDLNFSFNNESAKDIEKKIDKLIVENQVCLGIFDPSGGKLKDDLEKIIESDEAQNIFDKPLIATIDEIKIKELTQKPLYQIDKLDLYQKYAVRASLQDNTIIYGPPGTGKSEVISNIIANILMTDKDVMIVSEKAAALEVLSKRLKDLDIFMLLIHEVKNKDVFYQSIQKLTNYLGDSWINSKLPFYYKDKISNFFDESFEIITKFKDDLKSFEDFKKFRFKDFSFMDFINILNNFGGITFLEKLKFSNLIPKYQEAIAKFNLTNSDFFNLLQNFTIFCDSKKINEQSKFSDFLKIVWQIKKFYDDNSANIYNQKIIDNIKNDAPHLRNYLNAQTNYQEVLKTNPFKFYDDVKFYKEIKNRNIGLINDRFFTNFTDSIVLLKRFISTLKIAKCTHKKYIFDMFKNNLEIVEKKPFSKLFYKLKFSKLDKKLLQDLELLNSLHLDFYLDFNFIVQNQDLFNPLAIMFFFNKDVFDDKYYEFIKNKFYLLDLEFYELDKKFRIDENRWKQLHDIISLKSVFENDFPSFVSQDLFQFKIDALNKLDWNLFPKAILVITKNLILERVSRLSTNEKELLKKAIHVANLKRRPSLYNYLNTYGSVLKHLFPIWVARPEMASIFIPLKKNYFEYGIYDEASQMFLERAYPLLYRSMINIVAGDDKQLKPTNFFVSRDTDDEDDFAIDDLDVQESLLDRAKSSSWNILMLQNHYRSDSKELIEFSSKYIYENKLNYASKNGSQNFNALEVINVNGKFIDSKNVEEAEYVIKLLKENIDKYHSILIITFNLAQSLFISNLLLNSNKASSRITEKYMNQEIEVVNLENVQGNEADLVIMSIGYGRKNDTDRVKASFGPLVQDGGKNRLNVAITRARKKMIVLKSLSAHDIKDSNNDNLTIFKNFIAYLDSQNSNEKSNKFYNDFPINFENNLVKDIYKNLYQLVYQYDYHITLNYDVGNKKIDLGIVNWKNNFLVLGIMIENWRFEVNPLERQEVIDNQRFFEARGYKILRIFEYEWYYKKEFILDEISNEIKNN